MELSVWTAFWQLRCCGEPFAVGSEVAWRLYDTDSAWLNELLGTGGAGSAPIRLDAVEDHHPQREEGEPPVTRGTVVAVEAVHCQHACDEGGTCVPVPGSGTRSAVATANGWTPDLDGRKFVGYLVRLVVPDQDG
ncbi:DUF6578 domain-containing protein [Dactylosporangium cerinum]|uniref:DUF6578 domain-containing protein n=1 Tax=Dactylosporangium cerinum TaxID=1434730 RepID=A0ABV9WF83_9ACTN